VSDKLLNLLRGAKNVSFRTMYLSYIDRSGQPFAFGEFTKTDLDAHIAMVDELVREHEKLMGFLHAGSGETEALISEAEAAITRLTERNTELAVENARVRYLLQHGPGRGGDVGAAGEPGKPGK
jgi:hypothetical protein